MKKEAADKQIRGKNTFAKKSLIRAILTIDISKKDRNIYLIQADNILKHLSPNKANAIDIKELSERTGIKANELQRRILVLNQSGYNIINSRNGYYIGSDNSRIETL